MEYNTTESRMDGDQHIESVADNNVNDKLKNHHIGELSQHRDSVNHTTFTTERSRFSYNDFPNVTRKLVSAVVHSRKKANSVLNHCT